MGGRSEQRGRVVCPVSDRRVQVMQREPGGQGDRGARRPSGAEGGVTLRTRLFAPRPAPPFYRWGN